MDNPCIECNLTGYVEDYSDNYYPCIKCGGRGVITSSSRSQPSFTGHLSYKKCKCTGYYRAAYGVCVCEHKYEEHCSPSRTLHTDSQALPFEHSFLSAAYVRLSGYAYSGFFFGLRYASEALGSA